MRQFSKSAGIFRAVTTGRRAEILVYDEIGDEPEFFPVNPTSFAVALSGLSGAVDELVVRVNSPGGSVFAGVTMYNALRQFPGKKIVQIDGLCASIASVLAMGADEITMADSAMLMIHNPHVMVFGGESSGLRKMADLLDQVRAATMLPAYARSGKSESEILAVMAATTYYNATEAKAAGWIDTVLELPKPERLAASVSFDLRAFGAAAPRTLAKAVDGCTCDCQSCVDGDCTGCTHEYCDCDGCTCEDALQALKTPEKGAKGAENKEISSETAVFSAILADLEEENLRLADL